MLLVFAVGIFVSAFLLFLVQPMIAKMILPQLGGTPAVWNTCMVFFQAVLLAGYTYAHTLTVRLNPHRQAMTHLAMLILPLAVLPVGLAFEWTSSQSGSPIPWLLWLLTLSIGLPFFVLSTTAPLLQRWFSRSEHPAANDPYMLYAASNLGSMLALLGYPTVIEPNLSLYGAGWLSQSRLWSIGYAVLILLIAGAGWIMWRSNIQRTSHPVLRTESITPVTPTLGAFVFVRWVAWAFVPSSLMLGVTSYVTLNIAAIPLLWIVPLVLYLLSFILVFAKWPLTVHHAVIGVMPVVLVLLVFSMVVEGFSFPFGERILLHLMTLFVVALVCHGELARHRPPTEHLTAFYLAMSIGGVLGGIFNALVAPVMFNDIIEYEIALVVAGLLLPQMKRLPINAPTPQPAAVEGFKLGGVMGDSAWVVVIGVWTGGLVWLTQGTASPSDGQTTHSGLFAGVTWLPMFSSAQWLDLFIYAAPLALCYLMRNRPLRFGLGLAVVLLIANVPSASSHNVILHQERTFFGVLKVKFDREGNTHRLIHGNTNHGAQRLNPEERGEPLTYFHRRGPIGQLFESFQGPRRRQHIAVTGLGAGMLASYVLAGQSLTYYEINPAVVSIALNPAYFTYCDDAKQRGVDLQIVVGDGRLNMAHAPDGGYDLVILDAFSSDSLPVHLITREAFELYLRKMTENGVIAINVSNRYLDVAPVLGNMEQALHLVGLHRHDHEDEDVVPGKYPSHWVVLAKQRVALGTLSENTQWEPIPKNPALGIWTDDFSNVLSVFDWAG